MKTKTLKEKLKILWYIIIVVLFGPYWVPIDVVCWFSKKYYDIHDYHKCAGGDDIPSPFYEYTCWNCKSKFRI